jgi:hypothetical protein
LLVPLLEVPEDLDSGTVESNETIGAFLVIDK